jgi:hypothetical protein
MLNVMEWAKRLSERSAWPNYLLSLAIGLLFVFWLFPVDFILGQGPYWTTPRCDALQHVIGMRYFLADEWHFPLFRTTLIAPPEGVNVIYTDSLPLFALTAKLLRPWLTADVNYFGVWFFLTYILQGLAAVFLLRSLGVKTILPTVGGVLIALSFPPLLSRFNHAALSGHFLILFALGLYFRIVRQQAFGRLWGWFALLCWLALLVHAYLFVMVFCVFCAAAVQEGFSSKSGFRKSVAAGVITAGISGLLMWVSGYFHAIGPSWEGFGYKSMNVLSPWVPQRSGLFRSMDRIIDGTGGQVAAFNYLGFGVLLLLATALWAGRSEILSALRKYWGLALVLLALTLFAVSNRVYIGKWEVLKICDNPPVFFQQFAKSGRFFWPVGYTLMATGLSVTALRLRRPFSIALILVAAALQIVDAGPLRRNVAERARLGNPVSNYRGICASVSGDQLLLPADPWRALIASHGKLTIVPSFHCTTSPLQWQVLDLVFNASASATPVNTTYLARMKAIDCWQEQAALSGYTLDHDEVLVVFSPPINRELVSRIQDFSSLCRSFDGGSVCSRKWGDLKDSGLAAKFSGPLPRIPSNTPP